MALLICQHSGSVPILAAFSSNEEATNNRNDKTLLQDQVQGALLQGAHQAQPLQLSQGPLIQQHIVLTELATGCLQYTLLPESAQVQF